MPIVTVLEEAGYKLKKKTPKEWSCPCPLCGGEDRFCVWPEANKAWCRGCDWKGDDIQLLKDWKQMSFEEAREHARGISPDPPRNNPTKTQPKPQKTDANIVETYDYLDASGELMFQVVRMEPKSFRQRRPAKTKKGWIWDTKGVDIPLYHIQQLADSEYVFFVEGEKDVHNLEAIGLVATTSPMGAGKLEKLQEKHGLLNALAGKKVYLLPDNDVPGRSHAQQAAGLLYGIAKEIKIIELPGLNIGGDISDFIVDYGETETRQKLKEFIIRTAPWSPPKRFYSIDDLLNMQSDNHVPMIGWGILPYEGQAILAGEGGSGKSLLRLQLAIHLAMGWDWLGLPIPTARRVCIWQWENSEYLEKLRLEKMLAGYGIERKAIGNRIHWANRDIRYDITRIADRDILMSSVAEAKAEVCIFDCLSNMHSANENDNVKMRNVLDVFTDANHVAKCASLVVHHYNKPSETNLIKTIYRMRGAIAIRDWSDCTLLYGWKAHEHKKLKILEFGKIRDGPDRAPILCEFDPDTYLIKTTIEDVLAPVETIVKIIKEEGGEIKSGAEFIKLVMQHCSCGERTAREAIKTACDQGRIYKTHGTDKRYQSYRVSMMEAL